MNSEIYGVETTVPWGVLFSSGTMKLPLNIRRRFMKGLAYLAIFILLYRLYWSKKGEHIQGSLISLLCILVFTARFFIEFLKENQVAFEANMKINMGQLLSIPFILIGLAGLYWSIKKNKRAVIKR